MEKKEFQSKINITGDAPNLIEEIELLEQQIDVACRVLGIEPVKVDLEIYYKREISGVVPILHECKLKVGRVRANLEKLTRTYQGVLDVLEMGGK